ncbi:MAG: peptidase domain-containing ABC transporter [Planctomycetes bacterium]|nr:peptidase domain-containing ABC transporter [Planctomycetota bacterium]
MAANECGAACLAMILGYHGRATALHEARELCGPGRDGTSALALADAARHLGLRVRAYKLEPDDLARVPLPAIVHWNFDHYLVVERIRRRGIDVLDPAAGRRRITREEFDEGFTGVSLTFEVTESFRRRTATTRGAWLARARELLAAPGVKLALWQVLAASLVIQALSLVLPLLTKLVVDRIVPEGSGAVLPILAGGMLIWVVAQALVTYLRASLLVDVQARVDARLMVDFVEHLFSLPFAFFQQRTTGDLVLRLSSNAFLRELVTSQTVSAVFDGTMVIVYLGLLLAWEPRFGVVAVLAGLLQVVLVVASSRRVFRWMQAELAAQSESQSCLVEALNGIATLKASGAQGRALDRWTDLFHKQLAITLRRGQLSGALEAAMGALRVLAPLALLWIGADAVLAGELSLGSMLAFNALAASFLVPLGALVSSAQSLQFFGAHLDRIADVLDSRAEQVPEETRAVGKLIGRVAFEAVSFRYDPAAPLALSEVSFTVEPGRKVALVGRSGSGKTTLAKLLLGLHAPSAGRVTVDGLPVGEYDLTALRQRIGVVLQEPFLFGGTIRENIALFDRELDFERIVEAAGLAAVRGEIEALPLGFDTVLGEGGSGLSGGQRQRLALARALAHRPAILILDEATSHLDARTEAEVDAALDRVGCTRIVIAHRLSTVRNADQIHVLEAGAIAESGTHGELLARNSIYAELVKQQLTG